jgi:predicted nucleic acid-binding Zn ribbon protein
MPTYSLRCVECDKVTDHFVRQPSHYKPPVCCGQPMRKQVTRLAGFGFAEGNFSASSGGINAETAKGE